jgi:hypothetical protein
MLFADEIGLLAKWHEVRKISKGRLQEIQIRSV